MTNYYYPEQLPEKNGFESLPRPAQVRVSELMQAGRRAEAIPDKVENVVFGFDERRKAQIAREERLINRKLSITPTQIATVDNLDQIRSNINQIRTEENNQPEEPTYVEPAA